MQNPRLASRYAKSLLDLAVEQNSLDATLKDVQLLDGICRQHRDFELVLRSPIIKADKKQAVLKAVLDGRISKLTEAFIHLLVSKGRESNLPEVASSFISQYKVMNRIKTVKMTTAAPVTDAVKLAIINRIKASLPDYQIEITEAVNPDLIGGFVLEMDDKLFDASIRRDLNDVKAQFMKNIYISQI